MLDLRTLGTIELTREGAPVSKLLAQPKRMALLVYLAVNGTRRSVLREELRGLFWPDYPESRARAALNQALYALRKSLGPVAIDSRGAVALLVHPGALQCDAVAFDEAIARHAPLAALRLYRGDFLPGFSIHGTPEFERWVESTRGRLRFHALEAAAAVCAAAHAKGDVREAVRWARRRVELDPTDEVALRDLLTVLAAAGYRTEAAKAYKTFARDLAQQLEMAPSPETDELLHTIRAAAGRAVPESPMQSAPTVGAPIAAIRRRPWRRLAVAALLVALALARIVRWHAVIAPPAPDARSRAAAESLTHLGRFFWDKRTSDSLGIAINLFTRAVATDARYAPAYSGLADAYTLLVWYGDSASHTATADARSAAFAAVRLDPDLSDAHTSLGAVKAWFDHDWRGAEAEYRRAILLDSTSATAHQWYALGLASQGRIDDAVNEMRAAQREDPVSPSIATDLAMVLFWAGRDREATSQIRYALALDPSSTRASAQLWRLYTAAGQSDQAFAALVRLISARGGRATDIAVLRGVYARQGLRGALDWWAATLVRSGAAPDRAIRIAVLYALLNRNEVALRWLRKARDERSQFLQFASVDPAFRSLRGDPQFVSIVSSR